MFILENWWWDHLCAPSWHVCVFISARRLGVFLSGWDSSDWLCVVMLSSAFCVTDAWVTRCTSGAGRVTPKQHCCKGSMAIRNSSRNMLTERLNTRVWGCARGSALFWVVTWASPPRCRFQTPWLRFFCCCVCLSSEICDKSRCSHTTGVPKTSASIWQSPQRFGSTCKEDLSSSFSFLEVVQHVRSFHLSPFIAVAHTAKQGE